jgi:hypothetical protein
MVSIVTFGGKGAGSNNNPYIGTSKVELGWTDVNNAANLNKAITKINGLTANLGTFTQGGLMLARDLYLDDYAPKNGNDVIVNRYVVMLTDGNPTHMNGKNNNTPNTAKVITGTPEGTTFDGNMLNGIENSANVPAARGAAAAIAKQIKENKNSATLFTIGFGISSDKYANTNGGSGSYTGDEWLKTIADKHYTVTNTVTIDSIFAQIKTIILSGNNANLSGKYTFIDEGYTRVYDIKGNGSNIATFKITW